MKFKSLVYALFASLFMQASISIACAASTASNNANQEANKSNFIISMDKITAMQNAEKYVHDFRKLEKIAKKTNNVKDEMKIANTYFYGNKFVDKDLGTALIWFRRAALNNSSVAQNIVGTFYFKGVNEDLGFDNFYFLNVNHREAALWFLISSMNGNPKGAANFKKISHILSNKDIAKINEKAAYCIKRGLKKCDPYIAPHEPPTPLIITIMYIVMYIIVGIIGFLVLIPFLATLFSYTQDVLYKTFRR